MRALSWIRFRWNGASGGTLPRWLERVTSTRCHRLLTPSAPVGSLLDEGQCINHLFGELNRGRLRGPDRESPKTWGLRSREAARGKGAAATETVLNLKTAKSLGSSDRAAELAAELVRLKVDTIVTYANPMVVATTCIAAVDGPPNTMS
jgi:hypothetical protein